MKFTIAELKKIIKEEMNVILSEQEEDDELQEQEDALARIKALPNTAEQIADRVRAEIETAAEEAGLDYVGLASAVAGLITDN